MPFISKLRPKLCENQRFFSVLEDMNSVQLISHNPLIYEKLMRQNLSQQILDQFYHCLKDEQYGRYWIQYTKEMSEIEYDGLLRECNVDFLIKSCWVDISKLELLTEVDSIDYNTWLMMGLALTARDIRYKNVLAVQRTTFELWLCCASDSILAKSTTCKECHRVKRFTIVYDHITKDSLTKTFECCKEGKKLEIEGDKARNFLCFPIVDDKFLCLCPRSFFEFKELDSHLYLCHG